MPGLICFIAASWFAVTLGAFAEVEVRIQLQHNLGEGFMDAGLITGHVANDVRYTLLPSLSSLTMSPQTLEIAWQWRLQILPKTKLKIDWSVTEKDADKLRELAKNDGYAAIMRTTHLQ